MRLIQATSHKSICLIRNGELSIDYLEKHFIVS